MFKRSNILQISIVVSMFLLSCQNSYGNSKWHWADSRLPQEKLTIPGVETEVVAALDTGAHFSVISKDLLDALGVALGDEVKDITVPVDGQVYNLRRSKPFSIYLSEDKIPLTISPFVFDTTSNVGSSRNNLAEFLTTYPLLLGMEDLWKTNFRINYKAKTSEFKAIKGENYLPRDKNLSFLLNVEIGGQTVNCLLDTGAPDIPGIYIPKKHPEFETLKSKFQNFFPQRQILSASGKTLTTHDVQGKVATFEGVGLYLEFEDAPDHEGVGDKCLIVGGVLNEAVIKRFGRNSIYTAGILPDVEYNRLGFSEIYYDANTEYFTLTELFPHGALASSGVKPGDILLSVQGVKMTIDNTPKTRLLMRGAAGQKLIVRVATPALETDTLNDVRDLTITLTDVLANQ